MRSCRSGGGWRGADGGMACGGFSRPMDLPNQPACATARPRRSAARTGYPNSLRQRHLAHKASFGSARRSPPNVSRNERVKLSRHARKSLRHCTREIVTCGSKV